MNEMFKTPPDELRISILQGWLLTAESSNDVTFWNNVRLTDIQDIREKAQTADQRQIRAALIDALEWLQSIAASPNHPGDCAHGVGYKGPPCAYFAEIASILAHNLTTIPGINRDQLLTAIAFLRGAVLEGKTDNAADKTISATIVIIRTAPNIREQADSELLPLADVFKALSAAGTAGLPANYDALKSFLSRHGVEPDQGGEKQGVRAFWRTATVLNAIKQHRSL